MSTISSATAATTNLTQSEQARKTLTGNFEDFLTLFVTQLQHQDPLEPISSSEFTNSLANLSSVEQAVNMNSNMEKLLGLYSSTQVSETVGYIDKIVEFESNSFVLENGKGEFTYTLDEASSATPVAVLNEAGQIVFQFEGSSLAGTHLFKWDGIVADEQLPDGVYSVVAGAEDSKGEITPISTTGTGRVTGVSFADGETVLEVGSLQTSADDLITIRSQQ